MSEKEIAALEKELELVIEKLGFFSEESHLTSDFEQKFELKKRMEQLELRKAEIQKKLGEVFELDNRSFGDVLKEKIRELEIEKDEINILHLVNCNRLNKVKLFWKTFENSESKSQYYFIPACPHQMPPSLAERVIFEMLYNLLDGEMETMSLERRQDNIRLKRARFDLKPTLMLTQKAFKTYFCKRFQTPDFEDFINRKLHKMGENYEYITTIFSIQMDEWSDFAQAFLEWVIDTFSKAATPDSPTMLFFVVVYMEDFHDTPVNPKQHAIYNDVKNLIETHGNYCAVLKGLGPVPERDIISWFEKIGENNAVKVRELLELLTHDMSEEKKKQFLQDNPSMDMEDIEILQELVYETAKE